MSEDLYSQLLKRLDFHSERLNLHDKKISAYQVVQNDIHEIKNTLSAIKGNGNGAGHGEKIRDNRSDIDRHEKEIQEVRKFVDALGPVIVFYKFAVWGGTILGASIIALIWALITGSAELLFR